MEPEIRITRRRMHDGLCQQLTGAAMFARVIAEDLTSRGDPAAEHAQKLQEFITASVEEVQAIMAENS